MNESDLPPGLIAMWDQSQESLKSLRHKVSQVYDEFYRDYGNHVKAFSKTTTTIAQMSMEQIEAAHDPEEETKTIIMNLVAALIQEQHK